MGGGSYNFIESRARATTVYVNQTREEKFSQRHIDPEMDPSKFEVRESRDTENGEAFPIILALDETGSMGRIPDHLITNLLPDIMEKIVTIGVKNPQVCFVGIGDCDLCIEEAPLQVGQFEASDELMERWLKKIYLEGKGCGNGGENYNLAWYFAAKMTSTDSWEKRQKKGCLITIGDEPCLKYLSKKAIDKYIGSGCEKDITTSEILVLAQKEWDVYHIHCDGSRTYDFAETNWEKLLGDHAYVSKDKKADDLSELIPSIVKRAYREGNTKVNTETTAEVATGVAVDPETGKAEYTY